MSKQETIEASEENWQAMPEDGWMLSRIGTQQRKNEGRAKSKMKQLTDFRNWVCKWLDILSGGEDFLCPVNEQWDNQK